MKRIFQSEWILCTMQCGRYPLDYFASKVKIYNMRNIFLLGLILFISCGFTGRAPCLLRYYHPPTPRASASALFLHSCSEFSSPRIMFHSLHQQNPHLIGTH